VLFPPHSKKTRRSGQETLAKMVGTTRSRVTFFMNRFRKLGFIHYNGGLQVHSSLLSVPGAACEQFCSDGLAFALISYPLTVGRFYECVSHFGG